MIGSQLDRRITIEHKQVAQDQDYGTEVITWVALASRIPAQVFDSLPSKFESVQNGLRIAKRPARVRIRYMSGITSDMRVVVHGETDRTLQIVGGPAEIGRREWIELAIEEYSS